MATRHHEDERDAQVARLEVRLKVLAMEIVTVFRAAQRANASTMDEADALITYIYLEEMVEEYGVAQLLRLSELPLGTQSQAVLDELEAILNDSNRMEAGKLAAAARLLLGDQPRFEPTRTVH